VKGRHLVIGLLGALVVALGLLFWLGATGGGRGSETGMAQSSLGRRGEGVSTDAAAGVATATPSSSSGTLHDRRARDELRRKIFEAWAREGDPETQAAAKSGHLPPMPTTEDGKVDPKYIQGVIRNDMFPMATKCYEELLKRRPDAGGRVEMVFKIVGDDKLGGIIEEADIDGGVSGALGDEKMKTCITESLLSLSFKPPPKDGWVTVVYPIVLFPWEPSAGSQTLPHHDDDEPDR
jgi:hypothetical protein